MEKVKESLKGLELYEGLFDDVIVLNKEDKIDLKLFLEGEKNTVALNNYKDNYIVLSKTNISKDIFVVYVQGYSKSPIYNPFIKSDLLGVYTKNDNTMYYEYLSCYNDKLINSSAINMIGLKDFKNSLQDEINNKIVELVANNVNNLNLSEDELEEYNKEVLEDTNSYELYKSKAIDLLIKGENINFNSYAMFKFDKSIYTTYKDGYSSYYTEFKGLNTIKAIYDKELFISEVVNTILSRFKKPIYMYVFRNNKIWEFMQELKNNESLNAARRVATVLNNKDMKTLNITYKRNDKKMTFKIEGNPHVVNSDKGAYINSWRICDKNDRATFERTFREESAVVDIYLSNIETITYARKVLYQK